MGKIQLMSATRGAELEGNFTGGLLRLAQLIARRLNRRYLMAEIVTLKVSYSRAKNLRMALDLASAGWWR
jgi:hypothetical protein